MAAMGRPQSWRHGTRTGYRNRGCRCAPCKAAGHALYQQRKARRASGLETPRKAPPAQAAQAQPATTSWWVSAPQDGMTALAEREHLARMSAASAGKVGPLLGQDGWEGRR